MAEQAPNKNTTLHSFSASGSEPTGFMTFLWFFSAFITYLSAFACSSDLHDFPPDGRSPQTINEGQGMFLACQPPPHYPGTSSVSLFLEMIFCIYMFLESHRIVLCVAGTLGFTFA